MTFGWWRDARIRTKCVATLLVAVLGVAFFAFGRVGEKRTVAHRAGQVRTLSTLSVRIGDLLHETQRERGRTAQFMTSKGTKFASELRAQRKNTDQRLAEFAQEATAHQGSYPEAVRSAVATVNDAIDGIGGMRKAADALSAEPKVVIGQYTDLNATLLAADATTGGSSNDAEITRRLDAYVAFLSAKEKVGLERAQLSNAHPTSSPSSTR